MAETSKTEILYKMSEYEKSDHDQHKYNMSDHAKSNHEWSTHIQHQNIE